MTKNYLYKTEIPVNDKISIKIPTVGEILENEDGYYSLVTALTAMPIDFMCQLDDIGVDFTKISEYDLFLILFNGLKQQDTSLIFGDLALNKFEPAVNEQNGNVVLVDRENDIVIDRAIKEMIASGLRKIHFLEKNNKQPADEGTRKYLIERARKKLNNAKKRARDSQLESLIVAMVNSKEFKYDYETTEDLSIYKFNKSVRQIIKRVDYDNIMHGVYAGTINAKELNPDDLNWLTQK